MEDSLQQKLTITSYYIAKAIPKNYVLYHIEGPILSEIIDRRYSDFWNLRERLLENWPCVYVPGLPPKKALGNLEEDFILLRTKQLNHFLKELTIFEEFDNCKELIAFAAGEKNTKNSMNTLTKEDFSTILKKYQRLFTEYNPSVNNIIIYRNTI